MRIGHGFDVHAFGSNKPLIIGGVSIPYIHGLIAHSDGDIVFHAIIDALLGAMSLGDIGSMFPNTNKKYENINSRILIKEVWSIISEQNYKLSNIDISVIAECPKMFSYRCYMKQNISRELSCSITDVNVKFTTTEKLGFIGRKEGIACEAVVILYK